MTSIRRSRKALLGLAAFASVAAVLPFTNAAQALPPGTPPAGLATLTPASGTNATNFAISIPPLSVCPGDGINGYRFGTYITPITQDPAPLTFDGSGSPIGPAVTSSLRNPAGTFVRGLTPGAGDGLIALPAAGLSWIGLGPLPGILPAGAYNIGIACTLNDGDPVNPTINNERFWNTQITVTSTGATTFNYATGVVPDVPELSLGLGTGTEQTINIDNPDATLDAYNLFVLPPLPTLPTVNPGDTSFELTGLTLGESYEVVLEAVNAVSAGEPSVPLTFTASTTTPAPVVNAPNAFVGTELTVTWTAPASGPAPASYDVAITPGGPSFTGVAGLSQVIPAGLATGNYTATVTPNYPAGSGVAGAAGLDTFSINPNALIFQDITVERPVGALVLTQRCGVFGAFPAFDPPGWPGAELALDPVVAVGGAGTAPTLVDASGNDTGTPDPLFTSYPQRGSYPTLCGVNLGAGELVSDGPLSGRFFVADGSINQVTVLDTRDGDLGWNARGDIADLFTTGSGPFDENNSFSGDFLGWFPQVTSSSSGQSVTAGPSVGPGTSGGLTDNPTLASAPAGAGLGIATLDARLALLIPVAADADTYTARLSLTVA